MILLNKINAKIILNKSELLEKNSVLLENIENCEIYILYNLKALYVKNISNSKIFIGSVSGGTHITDSINCCFYLITHQLRIHQSHNTNFNIIISSNPILEDCTQLVFSSLKIDYLEYENNLKVKFF